MSLPLALRHARALIAGGWRPSLTANHLGIICSPHDEVATVFSLHDAVEVGAAGNVAAHMEALDLLQVLAEPGHARGLYAWEEDPARTQGQVLELFNRAIVRANALHRGAA